MITTHSCLLFIGRFVIKLLGTYFTLRRKVIFAGTHPIGDRVTMAGKVKYGCPRVLLLFVVKPMGFHSSALWFF